MVETQSKYLPELESIDTVSLPQNRYVFVEGQKNFKGKKKLNQSMLLNNCYFGVIQYQRAPELPLKKTSRYAIWNRISCFYHQAINQTGEGREMI